MSQQKEEQRDTDFNITDALRELRQRGYRLLRSLEYTMDDIWYGVDDAEELTAKVSAALQSFTSAYADWTTEVLKFSSEHGQRCTPIGNELGNMFNKYLVEQRMSPEQFAATTSFTLDETMALRSGKIVAVTKKLEHLPEEIQKLHQQEKSKAVESLCSELRSVLSDADLDRVKGILEERLVDKSTSEEPDELEDAASFMSDFRKKLK